MSPYQYTHFLDGRKGKSLSRLSDTATGRRESGSPVVVYVILSIHGAVYSSDAKKLAAPGAFGPTKVVNAEFHHGIALGTL